MDTYVARAVAKQMVADTIRAEKASTKEFLALSAKALLTHLSESGVLESGSMPDISAALADPDRLGSLYATGLLDSPREESYDRITLAAADALDVPFAAMSLVDVHRQFFKSTVGMGDMSVQESQTPIDQSICKYAVADRTPLVLEDARRDPIFAKHPVVRSGAVIAYLGIPLIDYDGHAIGTLCVFDSKPRQWGPGHIEILSDLAQLAVERIYGPDPASYP